MEYFVTIGIIMGILSTLLDVEDPFVPALFITIGLYSFGVLGDDDEKIAKATVAPTETQEQIAKASKKAPNISAKTEEGKVVIWTEEDDKRVNYECWDCGQQENTWGWNERN